MSSLTGQRNKEQTQSLPPPYLVTLQQESAGNIFFLSYKNIDINENINIDVMMIKKVLKILKFIKYEYLAATEVTTFKHVL